MEVVELLGSDEAVMADALQAQQAPVGGEADPFQILEVFQPSADIEVAGVVDHRLGAQRATLLVVLLDARALVVDVQRGRDALGDDAGSVPRRRAPADAPVEDQLHMVGAAQVEVLTHDLLEQHATLERAVEDLGESELGLKHGDVIADAGGAVGVRERMRQAHQPFAQQGVDLRRRQAVGQLLHESGVGAAENAVVQCLERHARLGQLPLQILVTVDAGEFRVVREARAERVSGITCMGLPD